MAEEEGESAEKEKEDEKKSLQLQLARRAEDLEKVSVFVLVKQLKCLNIDTSARNEYAVWQKKKMGQYNKNTSLKY